MLEFTPTQPIVNAGLLYINGLQISNISIDDDLSKMLSLNAGAARNSTNVSDIILSSNIALNGSIVGPNGCDVAVLIENTFYAVYVIADSTDYKSTAGLLSLASNSVPFLPSGYDMYRRVGWILTDSSANILTFWQYGNAAERMYYYDVGILALSNGSNTNITIINLSASVPPMDTEVLFQVTYTASSATNSAQFLTYGAKTPTNIIGIFGYGIAATQKGMITIPAHLQLGNINPSILYKVNSGDSLTLITSGYKDYLI